MKLRNALLCSAISAACATGAGHAFAQTSSDTAAPRANVLGEVVVTARRRSESLQKVPEAVTAFTQKALTEKAISNSFDLNRAVAGLTVSADSNNAGQPSFAIRGRGQVFGTSAGSVETYFAEVPLSAPFEIPTLPAQFFDLQSLQVLKGPQGTLFGRSTTGGAVVIVPQAPTDQFGGYARVQGGTYHDFQFEGAINLPLIEDKAALRLAAFDWQRDGYMHTYPGTPNDITGVPMGSQTYDNQNTTEFRATLLLTPFSGLTNSTLFTYHYDQTRSSGGSGLAFSNPALGGNGAVTAEPGYETRYTETAVDLKKPPENSWAFINTTAYELTSNLTVKNIFGYINTQGWTNDASDSDGTLVGTIDLPLPARTRKNFQTTDEIQLQGKNFDDRFTWTIGGLGDFTREPGINALDPTSDTLDLSATGAPITSPAGLTLQDGRFEQNNIDSYGLYGTGAFKVTDQINVTAGYRYNWYKISYLDSVVSACSDTPTGPKDPNCQTTSTTLFPVIHPSGATYNIEMDYHPTTSTMVYGGYRRGYKHGGFNPSDTDVASSSFGPESVDDFFVGLKDEFHILSMPARFNIEGYYDLYKGEQVAYLEFLAGSLTTITTNVPKTTFRGVDLDFEIDPTAWLSITGNYSHIEAFNTSWPDPTFASTNALLTGFGLPAQAAPLNLAINPVPYVVPNKVSVTFRLHKELDNNIGELVFSPTYTYQDRWFQTAFNDIQPSSESFLFGNVNQSAIGGGIVPAYATVDLRAEWNHVMGSKIDAAFNVTNLTNKVYFEGNSGTLQFGVQGNGYGPPRMVTFDLSTRF